MKKGFKVIGGCLLAATGITLLSVNHEWYYIVSGAIMVVVGNILAIETGGNENGINRNFKGR
ncbi:hypothetical protein PP655_gp048 [Bacillus phage PBC4]|uniref:Uncharacterized protein n=1 Tax=Bacillus phage PBC4 TaxID=1675028 RepID=A0A1D6X892_9CAUD|nr:hypothetical protein PP655_gp048 [Bacillus phage PBC4]AKQ08240.1 hypothetical protein PBC4_048 [Bacillus phage PBC4]